MVDKRNYLRVLVAEDVEAIAQFMERLLTQLGYQVEIVSDGAMCLEKLSTERFDLAILDIMMPKMHGIEVLRRIRSNSQTSSIGVIICTAKGYKPELDCARELGIAGIVEKPFQPAELLRAVDDYFRSVIDAMPLPTAQQRKEPAPYLPVLDENRPTFRLWGTRGSVPVSSPQTFRHGGNTSCMSLEFENDLIVLDAGSGLRELGLTLAGKKPRTIHLFISHTHWDHIQGFPFFAPIYIPGFEIKIYGAMGLGKDLRSLLSEQLDRDFFPVQMKDMGANLEFINLEEGPITIGRFRVFWTFTQHPGAILGFKVETSGNSMAYVCDNEFLKGYLGHPSEAAQVEGLLDAPAALVDFLKGVDLLVGEAQYTNEEYRSKIGWGHSSLSNVCLMAKLAEIKRWIVVHHDPMHDDEFLHRKLNLTRRILKEMDYAIEVEHGFDGMTGYL